MVISLGLLNLVGKTFKSDIFISVLKTINENPSCKLKEKNKLYVVFEEINSINEALKNLNIF